MLNWFIAFPFDYFSLIGSTLFFTSGLVWETEKGDLWQEKSIYMYSSFNSKKNVYYHIFWLTYTTGILFHWGWCESQSWKPSNCLLFSCTRADYSSIPSVQKPVIWFSQAYVIATFYIWSSCTYWYTYIKSSNQTGKSPMTQTFSKPFLFSDPTQTKEATP